MIEPNLNLNPVEMADRLRGMGVPERHIALTVATLQLEAAAMTLRDASRDDPDSMEMLARTVLVFAADVYGIVMISHAVRERAAIRDAAKQMMMEGSARD